VQLGMLAQLESLYAERERLTQALGTSDADDVVEVVAALRTEVESWRRLVELMEAQRRLDAERDAVQAELRRLQEAVGLVGVEVS
jgi:Tfp pilus assembly protein PilO